VTEYTIVEIYRTKINVFFGGNFDLLAKTWIFEVFTHLRHMTTVLRNRFSVNKMNFNVKVIENALNYLKNAMENKIVTMDPMKSDVQSNQVIFQVYTLYYILKMNKSYTIIMFQYCLTFNN